MTQWSPSNGLLDVDEEVVVRLQSQEVEQSHRSAPLKTPDRLSGTESRYLRPPRADSRREPTGISWERGGSHVARGREWRDRHEREERVVRGSWVGEREGDGEDERHESQLGLDGLHICVVIGTS